MNGLELSEKFYNNIGKQLISKEFINYEDDLAIGLVGHGSECFAYDDEISIDHDFEPSFCIWLTKNKYDEIGFKLFRAYRELPKDYMGYKINNESLFGSKTRGVQTISDFYKFYTGVDLEDRFIKNEELLNINEWLHIPSFYLAEATNGKIFQDKKGIFTKIRNYLKYEMPEDVRLKKLASSLFMMAQEGQYNYKRCIGHKEKIAAAKCVIDFSKNVCETIHLINKKHMPYYKWMFRSLKQCELLGDDIYIMIEEICESPYNVNKNVEIIEKICALIVKQLEIENLAIEHGNYLEDYAYQVNNKIKDASLRNESVIL